MYVKNGILHFHARVLLGLFVKMRTTFLILNYYAFAHIDQSLKAAKAVKILTNH